MKARLAALVALMGWVWGPPAHALGLNDALVIDSSAGTNSHGALFQVNTATGARTVVSDFGDATKGPLGEIAQAVAIEISGKVLVVDSFAGTNDNGSLVRVDPATGNRTLLSDFGVGTNPGINPIDVRVEASGQILVLDHTAGTSARGTLFRVNPTTGARTVVSDFGSGSNPGVEPAGLAIEVSGQVLVVDLAAGTNAHGALFRVNPSTGARTVVSDFGSGSNQGVDPAFVAVESSGQILVTDQSAGTNAKGALFRVNPTTGARTVVSDFGDANQGPLGSGFFLGGVAVQGSGQILVVDLDAGTDTRGGLFRVDPTTGARTLVSDFGDIAQGTRGIEPIALPEPSMTVLLCAGVCVLGLVRRGTRTP